MGGTEKITYKSPNYCQLARKTFRELTKQIDTTNKSLPLYPTQKLILETLSTSGSGNYSTNLRGLRASPQFSFIEVSRVSRRLAKLEL